MTPQVALAQRIANEMSAADPTSAVSLQMSIDNYLDVIRGALDLFANKSGMDTIYVSATITSDAIKRALEALDIDSEHIFFVDCISHMMMGGTGAQLDDHTTLVESPTMLENLMLKVEYLIRRSQAKKKLVVLDSINSLAIHNNNWILSEFLHILVSGLTSKEVYTVILSVEEHSTPEISNMVNLVCGNTIQAGKGGE
ncbi:MAG TPA: ATPase domain-containing protein [Thermoplasmata archaeon]|nr:ATPase domain-containing protein [Thermoplasmata archaeon]